MRLFRWLKKKIKFFFFKILISYCATHTHTFFLYLKTQQPSLLFLLLLFYRSFRFMSKIFLDSQRKVSFFFLLKTQNNNNNTLNIYCCCDTLKERVFFFIFFYIYILSLKLFENFWHFYFSFYFCLIQVFFVFTKTEATNDIVSPNTRHWIHPSIRPFPLSIYTKLDACKTSKVLFLVWFFYKV